MASVSESVSCPLALLLVLLTGADTQHGIHGPVFLLEPPALLSFSNSTGSQVSCSAHGSPTPEVTWLHQDGTVVTAVPGFRQALNNGTLYFPPFRAEDYREDVHSTVYRCRASNQGGVILSRDVRVRAVVRQQYDVQVYRVHVILGNTAVLRCVIPAFVKDYVTVTSWFRDDTIILPGRDEAGGRYVVTSNGDLHIRSAQPEDATSRYSCLTLHALTGERKRSASATLTVTDPTGSMPPRLTQRSVSTLSVEQGDDVHLSCDAQSNPPPTFTWLREVGGQLRPVTPSLRITPAQDVLHIRHVGPEDAGRWMCRVANQFGEQRLESQLSVTSPLSAHVQPQIQVVNSGQPATFNCSVGGAPVDDVTWFHNGRPATEGAGGTRLLSQHTLVVAAVSRADRGMYQCFVSNDREASQGSAELRLGDTMPELQSTFIEQVLSAGPPVSLRCSATGSPPPHFTWALDGQILTASAVAQRYTIGQYVDQAGDVISHVNISSVRVQDGGLYSCSASNTLGTANYAARLNIYGPPYIRMIDAVRAVAGSDVTVHCPYSGYPISSVTWERHGQPLPPDLRHHVSSGGSLTINRVEHVVDAGSYTCVVRGPGGESARRDIQLTVNSPPVLEPFFFPTSLQEGGRAQVSCSISSGDLPIHFSWLKDGSPISPSLQIEERAAGDFFSILVFNKVNSQHSGAYTCIAKNEAASVNYTAQLLVKVAPQWLMEPQDVATLAGGSISIHCQAQGFPQPRITWLRGRDRAASEYQPLEHSAGHIILASNGSLLIPTVAPHHEGYYLCRADNGIGAGLSKVVAISVNEPVRFEMTSKNVTARRGDPVTLTCDVHGDQPIQVDWNFNGQRLHHSYRSSLTEVKSESGLRSQLVIGHTDRQDSGLYLCQAGNVFGHSELAIYLAVQEPPDPPMDLQIVEVGSRAVRLSWRPPFDGHSALLEYLIQFKPGAAPGSSDWGHAGAANLSVLADDEDYTALSGGESSRSTIISGLHPATTYHIRMLAINGIEASAFTDDIAVKTQEEVPVGAPVDVQIQTLGPEQLMVSWKPPQPETWNGDLLGYTIDWSVHRASQADTNHSSSHTVRGLAVNELRLTDLRKFTRYDVTVRAFNSVGLGPRSTPVTATTQEGVPEASPQNVSCSPLSSQSVKVSWTPPPAARHGGVLQGYKVVYRPVLSDRTLFVSGSEVKRTSSLETYLHGLLKFTNYSIRLLAYTGVGDGQLSEPVYCTTEQDVPGPPAAIKALALTSDSILVSWMPPEQPNGHIVQYTVYMSEGSRMAKPSSFPVRVGANIDTVFEVRSLAELQRYEFRVTASTIVGEGDGTRPVAQSPNSRAPARIASFSQVLRRPVKTSVTLPCLAVGNPTPTSRWLHRREVLRTEPGSGYQILTQGALHVNKVEKFNEGNYTCSAKNLFGEDHVVYQVLVLTAPEAPNLELVHAGQHSIGVQWSAPPDGGAALQGYVLSYKRDHGNWQEVHLDADRGSHTLTSLHCGSTYHTYLTAHNRVGNSRPSAIVTANTKGDVPQVASASSLLSSNSTSVTLHLSTWPDGGCPLLHFVVEYRIVGTDDGWSLVDNNVDSRQFTLRDLVPGTWYHLRVTAHNDAGSTRALFNVATTTVIGATIAPLENFNNPSSTAPFYHDVYVMVPAVCAAILLLSAALLAYVAIHRRSCQRAVGYKRGQGLPESPSVCKAAAEMDNRKNFQQIYSSSPSKVEEHHNIKQVETTSELYEMSPYATFAVASDPPRAMSGATLDYTVQFKTFGHSENDSSAHHEPVRQKKHRHTASDGEGGRQSALASARLRLKAENPHDSESDTSGSPSAVSSYRVPVKQTASRSLELYRLDSSTESNETSPLPERRRTPRHYPACSSQRAQAHDSSFLLSCHSSESSSAEDDASFSSYRLQPPSGFCDSRELSEAECDRDRDRDTCQLDKLLARFHQQKEQERLQYTIHV